MGTNICGWIEINTVALSDEDCWFRIVEIDVVAERNYNIFARLFGIRCPHDVSAIANGRGIPEGKRSFLQDDYLAESFVGHTWIGANEIKEAQNELQQIAQDTKGWQFIFSALSSLSDIYGDSNVRLVAWFDNYG